MQTAHALADFAIKFENEFKKWHVNSNYLCYLEIDECQVEFLLNKLDMLKIKYSIFLEPDIGNKMTAIAIEAIPRKQHKKLFKKLKLTCHE